MLAQAFAKQRLPQADARWQDFNRSLTQSMTARQPPADSGLNARLAAGDFGTFWKEASLVPVHQQPEAMRIPRENAPSSDPGLLA
jgi:hypothetical protein